MARSDSSSNQPPLPSVRQTSALSDRVARLMLIRLWMRTLLRLMPWALGAGLLMVIGIRWWGGESWALNFWWGFPVACILVAAVAGLVPAWRSRPDRLSAAGWLDESAHTQSRFRSALELAVHDSVDPAFADLAVDAAERVARDAAGLIPDSSKDTRPWHQRPSILSSVGLLVLTVAAGVWMPARTPTAPELPIRSVQSVEEAQEQIHTKQEELQAAADLSSEDDELVQQALDDLAEIEQELLASDDPAEPDSATALADSRIQRLADELDERSQQQEQEEQELRERLDKLRSESLADDSQLERFREQLAEGRYEDAIEELDQINKEIDSMSQEQRENAARDLESLANAIDEDSPDTEQNQSDSTQKNQSRPSPAEELSESMKDEAERIREFTPESEQSTQDTNPPESRDPDSQEAENKPQPEQGSEQQDQESASESKDSENGEDQSSPDQSSSEQSPQGQPAQREPGQEGKEQQTDPNQHDESGSKSSEQSETTADQQSKETSESNTHEQNEQSNQDPDREPAQEPSQQSEQQPGQDPSSQDQTGKQPNEQPNEEPEKQSDQDSSKPTGEETAQESPDEQSQREGQEPSEQSESQDRPGRETDLKEMLREAQRRSDGAQRDREAAERLREQLEESQDQQSQSQQREPQDQSGDPQESSEPGDQAQNQGEQEPQQGPRGQPGQEPGSGSSPGNEDPSDANPDPLADDIQDQSEYIPVQAADENAAADEDSKPLGRWYNPDQEGDRAASGKSETAQRFRNASKKAREEVNDRRVPRKYRDVISEYFKKLDDRAGKLAPSPSSGDGQDAPSPSKGKSDGGSD